MTTLSPSTKSPNPPPYTTLAEEDRRHLLAPSLYSASLAPSIADSSAETGSGTVTPRASSPALRRATLASPEQAAQQPNCSYKGFPSEAAYLAALQDWAETKKYAQNDVNLLGFYGHTTMQEYASRPKLEGLGIAKRLKARKERKAEARRNSTM